MTRNTKDKKERSSLEGRKEEKAYCNDYV